MKLFATRVLGFDFARVPFATFACLSHCPYVILGRIGIEPTTFSSGSLFPAVKWMLITSNPFSDFKQITQRVPPDDSCELSLTTDLSS
jgi:hypothetical protein